MGDCRFTKRAGLPWGQLACPATQRVSSSSYSARVGLLAVSIDMALSESFLPADDLTRNVTTDATEWTIGVEVSGEPAARSSASAPGPR